MAKISVGNETADLLCLWVEPWGTDHWMRPGEALMVVIEAEPAEDPYDVVVHGQGVTVWVNTAYEARVLDTDGAPVPCGHQRPEAAGG